MNTLVTLLISYLAAFIFVRGIQGVYNLSLTVWENYSARMECKADILFQAKEFQKERDLCERMLRKIRHKPLIRMHKIQYANTCNYRFKRIRAAERKHSRQLKA